MEKLKPLRSQDSRSKDSADKAKTIALKLLGYRQRSEYELRERLKRKGFSPDIIEDTIRELKNSGLIDDREAARSFIRVGEQRFLGKRAIEELLFKRGIRPELIEEVIEDFDEIEGAERAAQKWLRRHRLDSRESEERLKNFLLRRGYSIDTANRVIEKMKEE